ncbi:MAG: hypothetical protein ABI550_03735, partial [Ignavibacteriaceae bacterium]
MEEIKIDNSVIQFDKGSFNISQFRIDGLDLDHFLNIRNEIIIIKFNPFYIKNWLVKFSDEFKKKILLCLEIISKSRDQNKGLSANLSTKFFNSLITIKWQ